MTFPDTTIDWALLKLLPLFRMRGAPKSVGDRELFAAAVLRIAHPKLVELRAADPFSVPTVESIDAALAADELDAVQVRGANPFEWLVTTVVDESRWFLEPVDLRAIFIERYPCADGKKAVNDRSKVGEK